MTQPQSKLSGREILVSVVEGRNDVAAAVRLFARIASYGSQRHEKRISKEKLLIKSLKVGAMWLEGKAVSQPLF